MIEGEKSLHLHEDIKYMFPSGCIVYIEKKNSNVIY